MLDIKELDKKQLGDFGERIAFKFLKKKGYRIKHVNYRLWSGEIDIIGFDKDFLCFVEVKSRKQSHDYHPLFSITKRKQKQLSKLACIYIKKFKLYEQKARFDVITIIFKDDNSYDIDLFKNAFNLDKRYTL